MSRVQGTFNSGRQSEIKYRSKAYKTAYTARLATVKGKVWTDEVDEFAHFCRDVLRDGSTKYHPWKKHWTDILEQFSDDIAASYGTVWNIMSGAEAETEPAFHRVRDAMTGKKSFDKEEWRKMFDWSKGEIVVRTASDNPDENWQWTNVTTEDEKTRCDKLLSGSYAPRSEGSKALAHSGLQWQKMLDMHHYSAKDCTRAIGQKAANKP